jgi:uncharacterized membrane protein YczE
VNRSHPRAASRAPELAVVTFPSPAELRRRLPRLVLGCLALGVGIGLTVTAHLGVSPWDVLHQGIARHSPLSFGTVVVVVGLAVLLLWIPLGQRPGLGTVLNTLTVGYVADATLTTLSRPDDAAARWALLVAGILFIAVGIGLYIGAGLGPGPRDGLMTGITARGHRLWVVRTGLELAALAAGWSLGGDVGVGTLLFAFAIGPLGHFFLARLHLGVDEVDPDPDAALGE